MKQASDKNQTDPAITTSKPERRRILIWGILCTLCFAVIFAFKPNLMQRLDYLEYDFLLAKFPNNNASNKLVIVDLDEKSLNRYGQWPWPRYRVAGLLDKVAAMQPDIISLDIVFAEPDRTSAGPLLKDLGDVYRIKIDLHGLPRSLKDNDQILAQTLAGGPFVLGTIFHFDELKKGSDRCVLHPVKSSYINDDVNQNAHTEIPVSTGVLCNLPMLSDKVSSSGFFNFSPDSDGVLRRLPMLIQYHGQLYPNLALATVLKLKNENHVILKKDRNHLQSIHYRGNAVPVDRHGQMLIKFRSSAQKYEYVSAADILDNNVSPERLRGRIVFVGTSAVGLKELLNTPLGPVFPGVEVHATAVDNLLKGDFISLPGWSNGFILLLVMVSGLAMSLLISYQKAATGFVAMLLFAGGLWMTTHQVFFRMGFFVATAFPIASVICNYMFLTALKYRMEEKKNLAHMQELLLTQDITIESLANLTEHRHQETGGHIKRTRLYVRLLADHMKHRDKYRTFLNDENIEMLDKSAPLHDIGKVGIPDKILLKPGKLTGEEFEIIKTHTTNGRNLIRSSVRQFGKISFLNIAEEIAYTHHEKWDGSGYPQGLKGDAIPISGRLMALADVYDALISKRVYKEAYPHAEAVEIIVNAKGKHFDPDMVDAFLEIHEQFRNIAREHADSQEAKESPKPDAA
ncbi:MAG TPA: CHASE2 domain-containing protein [Smithella sp.]|nr:CHASE2 domain-containing protein [Smithella sp.]